MAPVPQMGKHNSDENIFLMSHVHFVSLSTSGKLPRKRVWLFAGFGACAFSEETKQDCLHAMVGTEEIFHLTNWYLLVTFSRTKTFSCKEIESKSLILLYLDESCSVTSTILLAHKHRCLLPLLSPTYLGSPWILLHFSLNISRIPFLFLSIFSQSHCCTSPP